MNLLIVDFYKTALDQMFLVFFIAGKSNDLIESSWDDPFHLI